MRAKPAGLFSVILVFWCTTAAIAGDSEPVTTAAPVVGNLVPVVLEIEATQRLIGQIRKDVETARQLLEDSGTAANLEITVQKTRQSVSVTGMAEASLARLMDMETALVEDTAQLDQWIERLSGVVGQLESDLDLLSAASRRWLGLLDVARNRSAPAFVIKQGEQAEADIAGQQSEVYPVRDGLLQALATRSSLRQTFDALRRELVDHRETAGKALRGSASVPLWQLGPLQPGMADAAQKALGTWLSGIARYLELHWLAVVVICVAQTIPTRLLLSLGAQLSKDYSPDILHSQGVLRIIERPWWTVALLCLLGLNFTPAGPVAYYDLLWLMLILPAVVLIQAIHGNGRRLSFQALGLAIAMFPFRTTLEAFPVIDRWVLLLQALFMVIVLMWEGLGFRSGIGSDLPRHGFRLGLVIGLSVAMLSNLAGYAGLARVLVDGLLGTMGFAMVYIVGLEIVYALLLGCLNSPAGRRLWSVSANLPRIALGLRRLLVWLTVGMVVFGAVYAFRVNEEAKWLLAGLWALNLPVGSFVLPVRSVISSVLWLVGTFTTIRVVLFLLEQEILPRFCLSPGVPLAVTTVARYFIATVGGIMSLLALGVDVSKVTLLAGAVGVGVGFGLQNIFNNLFSGLILLFERPIHQGDVIEWGKQRGTVAKIGTRSSIVRTGDGAEVIVPNADLIAKEVVNWTLSDRRRRIDVTVSVARSAPEEAVLALLQKVAGESADILKEPGPEATLTAIDPYLLEFQLTCWILRYEDQRRIASRLRVAIHQQLAASGIVSPMSPQPA